MQLAEARGIALGGGNQALLVTFGLLQQPGRRTMGLGDHVVGVGLAFVFLPFLVLTGFHRVVERGLHLLGRLGVLHGHLGNQDARLVTVEDFLHQRRGLDGNLLAAFVEHEVHLALADDLANRRFRHLHHRFIRHAVVEDVIDRILENVLDGKLDVDDVFVIGQHQRFFQHLVALAAAIADFERAHAGNIDQLMRLNRVRQTPAQAGLSAFLVAAELQHQAALRGIDDVKTAGEPEQQHDGNQEANSAT